MSTLEQKLMETASLSRWCDSGILLAVSGGADSVAMLRCFATFLALPDAAGISDAPSVHIAHVNHALRGNESNADALFVRDLAATFHLPYHEIRLTAGMFDADDSGSFEAAARKLRYDFLRKTAEKHALRYVATAHHADDRIETVLHRIIRGTGIAGLAGIPEFRRLGGAVTVVRPMLSFSRQQIVEYLQEKKQPFRVDSTNRESVHTRNKIRNRLLPELTGEYNPSITEAIGRLSRQAADWSDFIRFQTETLYDLSVEIRPSVETGVASKTHNTRIFIRKQVLRGQHRVLVRELFVVIWKRNHWPLRNMRFEHWNRLAETAFNLRDESKIMFPGQIAVQSDSEHVVLEKTT
ncbi:MAG: tRNA lysidine(34) synthetase TilS [Planctomycetaceae bacterium]|nr:tRNA lysidine(34) synthetase TilS [Planctomycetaceae bacterium]